MYKIFIDTNIFLDFYRINNKEEVKKVLEELTKYKRYLIHIEQSNDEFLRNRDRTISDFIKELKKQNYCDYANNFIVTLDEYEDYAKSIKEANNSVKMIIKSCENLITNPNKDLIYNTYINLYDNHKMYLRTDKIIDCAIKRKYIGNPPVSNKNTCCDEIIWETLLQNCKQDLILVSRDGTFKENYIFLKNEYKRVIGKEFLLFDSISEAIQMNGEIPSQELENIESDLLVENELLKYGYLSDNSHWVNIIYNSLVNLGGEATLKDIYNEVYHIVESKYPEKLKNKEIEATIRGILQRYCSDTSGYNKKVDLFNKLERGKWAIRFS